MFLGWMVQSGSWKLPAAIQTGIVLLGEQGGISFTWCGLTKAFFLKETEINCEWQPANCKIHDKESKGTCFLYIYVKEIQKGE